MARDRTTDQPIVFTMDFNEPNRRAIARLLRKRGLASRADCAEWITETINNKIMGALTE